MLKNGELIKEKERVRKMLKKTEREHRDLQVRVVQEAITNEGANQVSSRRN